MYRDIIDIRNGAETLTLSRFAAIRENGRARSWAYGVDRALRHTRSDGRAMGELRAFLALHALMSFGYVSSDDEVLRIAEAAIARGALEARLTVDEKQYRPTGSALPAPSPPRSSTAPSRPILSRSPNEVEKDFANEKAQAATLEEAAKNGTPFCEICEKMKADRARAAA